MGPVLESEIVTGKERARVGVVLELELMFCLVALMTCEQAHSTQMDAHLHTGHSLPRTVTKVCARAQEQVEHVLFPICISFGNKTTQVKIN